MLLLLSLPYSKSNIEEEKIDIPSASSVNVAFRTES